MLPCPGASLSLSHSPRLRNNPPFMSPIVGSEWLCHDVPSTRVRLYLISAGSRPPPPLSFVVCLGLPRASSVALAAILAIPPAASISSLFQQSYEATNDSRTPSQATTGRVPEGYHLAILRGGRCSMGAILLSPGRYDLGWARPVNHATPALYPLVPRVAGGILEPHHAVVQPPWWRTEIWLSNRRNRRRCFSTAGAITCRINRRRMTGKIVYGQHVQSFKDFRSGGWNRPINGKAFLQILAGFRGQDRYSVLS